MAQRNLGYPWEYVNVPEGWLVFEIPAACDAENHFGHPFCHPEWQGYLPEGAEVLAGPVLGSSGWIVLVGIPPQER